MQAATKLIIIKAPRCFQERRLFESTQRRMNSCSAWIISYQPRHGTGDIHKILKSIHIKPGTKNKGAWLKRLCSSSVRANQQPCRINNREYKGMRTNWPSGRTPPRHSVVAMKIAPRHNVTSQSKKLYHIGLPNKNKL